MCRNLAGAWSVRCRLRDSLMLLAHGGRIEEKLLGWRRGRRLPRHALDPCRIVLLSSRTRRRCGPALQLPRGGQDVRHSVRWVRGLAACPRFVRGTAAETSV